MKFLIPGFISLAVLFVCTTSVQCAEQVDVVVIGGTPGGIAAALSAGRAGHSVLLVEEQLHLGGMMTSGLGKSDVEKRDLIGGVFVEFTKRVKQAYVSRYGPQHPNIALCQDGYYYEPSVAERILNEMLREVRSVTTMTGWRLNSARCEDRRLADVEIVNDQTQETRDVAAKVFIDATYEGDLFAAAGARFRVGREARDEFQEPHAGVVYFDFNNKEFLPGSTGTADDRIPAYTYRLCLTTDPDNAVPLLEPPPDYNRSRYLGYFDDLQAGRLAGPKNFKPGRGYNPAHFNTLVRALSVTPLPNRKTDVNINPRPLGFLFAEENRGYLEGTPDQRREIRERIRNLTLGLLWFLQTDAEIPEEHRRLARAYHLPLDEFADNGHFPFQLYVREGRRLRALYTLTELDVTGDPDRGTIHHADSIAIGEFPIDSFPCRKRQPGDSVVLEGYLGMLDHITRPYEIPYRIMIPEELDGLIVPVAAGTTHVAYSSIRMEPTWMALGQAAGTAAHLAIADKVAPRHVDAAKLQKLLVQNGQIIHHQDRESKKAQP